MHFLYNQNQSKVCKYINKLIYVNYNYHIQSFFFIYVYIRKNMSFLRQLARIRLKPLLRTIKLYTLKRSKNKQKQIIIITIVIVLMLFIQFGYHSIYILYLYGHPFCLDAFHVALLTTAQTGAIFLVSLVMLLLKRILKDSYILPIIGVIFYVSSLILFGIAKKIWLLYLCKSIESSSPSYVVLILFF